MKCSRCREEIDLITKKDPDTKMYYNKWWCKTCDDEAFPSLPSADDMRFGQGGGFKDLVMDEEVEALEVEEEKPVKVELPEKGEIAKKIVDQMKGVKIHPDIFSKGFRQGLIDSHQIAKTFPKQGIATVPEYFYKKAKQISGVGIIDKDGRAKIVTQKKSGQESK